MSEVHIVANLYPKPDKIQRFEELLNHMCHDVHSKEPDAHRYLMTKVTGPDVKEPEYVMIETYKSQQVATEHGQTEYFKKLFEVLGNEGILGKDARIIYSQSVGGFDVDRKLVA